MRVKADGRSVTVTLKSWWHISLRIFAAACKAVQRAALVTWQNESPELTGVQASLVHAVIQEINKRVEEQQKDGGEAFLTDLEEP